MVGCRFSEVHRPRWMSQRSQPERACKKKRGIGKQSAPEVASSDSGVCEKYSVLGSIGGGDSYVITSGSIVGSGDITSESSFSDSTPVCSRESLETVRENMDGSSDNALETSRNDNGREDSGMRGSEREDGSEGMFLSVSDMRNLLSSLSSAGRVVPPSVPSHSDRTRHVIGLAPHKDGIDIAKYIRKLEADLADLSVPRSEYKTILYQKLSSKTAASIVSSVDRATCSYEDLKQILIDSLGSGKTSLGSKLTAEFNSDVRNMNPLDKYVHLKGLIDSVDMTVLERSDILLFFAMAIYRASLTAQQRSVMDGREIDTFRDLNKLALSLHSTDNDRSGSARWQGRGTGDPVKCFKCYRFGHKSFECRMGKDESKPVVCYTCHQPGHKSPDCPSNSKDQVKQYEGNKKLGLRSGSKPFSNNWVAVQGDTPLVQGTVNGDFILVA